MKNYEIYILILLFLISLSVNCGHREVTREDIKNCRNFKYNDIITDCLNRTISESLAYYPHLEGLMRVYQVEEYLNDSCTFEDVETWTLDSTYIDTVFVKNVPIKKRKNTIFVDQVYCISKIIVYSIDHINDPKKNHSKYYRLSNNKTYEYGEKYNTYEISEGGGRVYENIHSHCCLEWFDEDSIFVGYNHSAISGFYKNVDLLNLGDSVHLDGMRGIKYTIANIDTSIIVSGNVYDVIRLYSHGINQETGLSDTSEWYFAKGIGLVQYTRTMIRPGSTNRKHRYLLHYENNK